MLVKGSSFLAFGLLLAPVANAVWLPSTMSVKDEAKQNKDMSLCFLCKLMVEHFDNVVANGDQEDNICDSLDGKLSKKCKKLLKKIVFESDGQVHANEICEKVDACDGNDGDEDEDEDDDISTEEDDRLSTSFRPGVSRKTPSDKVSSSAKVVACEEEGLVDSDGMDEGGSGSIKLFRSPQIYDEEKVLDDSGSIKIFHPPHIYGDDAASEDSSSVKIFHPLHIDDDAKLVSDAARPSIMKAKAFPEAKRAEMWTEIIIVEVPVEEEEEYVYAEIDHDFEAEKSISLHTFYHMNAIASLAIVLCLCYYLCSGRDEEEYVVVADHSNFPPSYETHVSKAPIALQ